MNMKKILALLTSAAMAASMTAVVASAEGAVETRVDSVSGLFYRVKSDGTGWNGNNNIEIGAYDSTAENVTKEVQLGPSANFKGFGVIYKFDLGDLDALDSVTMTLTSPGTQNGNELFDIYTYSGANTVSDIYSYCTGTDIADAKLASVKSTVKEGAAEPGIYTAALDLAALKSAADENGGISLMITNLSTGNRCKLYVDGKDRPYLTVTKTSVDPQPDNSVAKIGDQGYDNIIDALKNVPNNGTIEVCKDSTLSERALLDKLGNTAAKNITINGNNHTITGPNNTMAFEVPGGYKLTFNDAVVVGGTNYTINVKKNGTLNLNNTTVGAADAAKPALNVGGTVNASGTSTINSMLFNSTSDNPVVNLTDDAKLTGTIKPTNTTVTIAENYALITGTTTNCTAAYSNSSNKDYELVNGVFVKKAEEEVITMTPEFVGVYTGDKDDSKAAAYRASFKSSTGATASLNVSNITWKLNDTELNVSSDNTTGTITLNGTSEVVYGIIISGVSAEGTLSAAFN